MKTGIFPGSESCIFSFCRNLSKRCGAYSFGPSQPDRPRDWRVPWQGMFLAEGLSPLTWQVGWGSAGLAWGSLPWCGWKTPPLSTQQNSFALQKHLSLLCMSVVDMANLTCELLAGRNFFLPLF